MLYVIKVVSLFLNKVFPKDTKEEKKKVNGEVIWRMYYPLFPAFTCNLLFVLVPVCPEPITLIVKHQEFEKYNPGSSIPLVYMTNKETGLVIPESINIVK